MTTPTTRTNAHVHLVGAGPGDPGLITVRALELVRTADVIIHDRLIPLDLLASARPSAVIIDAGKSRDRARMSQDEINRAIVEHARRGRTVVRLKGGDPFVFGRATEEIEACRAAGIPVEITPGITSAIAAPAAAGIPVTSRGLARSFAVVTAETAPDRLDSGPDYHALAHLDTVVFLMGRARVQQLAEGLIGAGRDAGTPAAVVARAWMSGEQWTTGTLANIASRADEAGIGTPAVLVVGAVAALADTPPTDRARAEAPLAGRRVVVTRPRTASGPLNTRLRELGAEVIESPLIRIEYRDAELPNLTSTLRGPSLYDWIVFTSIHGVEGFWRAVQDAGLDARAFAGARIAAVGPATAEALRHRGLEPDLVPSHYRAEYLARELIDAEHEIAPRALFPCGTRARVELTTALRAAGWTVNDLLVYDTLSADPPLGARREIEAGVDAILFHSPSAVRSFVDGGLPAGNALIACIGPTTGNAARELGLEPDVIPEDHTDEALVCAVAARLTSGAAAQPTQALA